MLAWESPSPQCCPGSRRSRTSVARRSSAYAVRRGQSEQEYVQAMGEPLTPERAGSALVELVKAETDAVAPAYLLSGAGLQTLP